jgi:phage shock protein E
MNLIIKYKLAILGVIIGAIGGYLYYANIGCSTGTCMITSRPVNSTLYGAMLGGLLFSMFQKEKRKDA